MYWTPVTPQAMARHSFPHPPETCAPHPNPVVVFNPQAHDVEVPVCRTGSFDAKVGVVEAATGLAVPSQLVPTLTTSSTPGIQDLCFLATLPALGFTSYYITASATHAAMDSTGDRAGAEVRTRTLAFRAPLCCTKT